MNDVNEKAWAAAKFNNYFIYIETYSGFFNCLPDPEGKRFFLSRFSSDIELGARLIEALAVSRTVDPKKSPDFFDIRGRVIKEYDEWVAQVMVKFNYQTRRALFKNMKSCSVDAVDGLITLRPSHHEKLEAWSGKGITQKDHVIISSSSPHEEIGAALRLAFSRCT